MESNGAPVNVVKARELSLAAGASKDSLTAKLNTWANKEVNWFSSEHLARLLYDDLKLESPPVMGSPKAIKKAPKGAQSTSEASLDWLWFRSPPELQEALRDIIALRKARKYQNDYLEKICVSQRLGRLHAQFSPSTATGRLACSNPPLQQIPGRDPYGIRSVFEAGEGFKLAVIDYSQLEVYVLGHILIKLFKDDSVAQALKGDVYGTIAKKTWPDKLKGIEATALKGHPDKAVTKLRDFAKVVVLATVYGKTPEGLAVAIRDDVGEGIGLEASNKLLSDFGQAYPGVGRYQRWASAYGRDHGGVSTLLGRFRPIPELDKSVKNKFRRAEGERQASNSPIQGSAADIVACAMITAQARLPKEALVCLSVHDELVAEVPEAIAEDCYQIVVDSLEKPSYIQLEVPLKAEGKLCAHWGEMKQ